MGGGWLKRRPGRFTSGKETRYPLCRRLGGPQGRSGRLRKISLSPGTDPRTVRPVASRYFGLCLIGEWRTEWRHWYPKVQGSVLGLEADDRGVPLKKDALIAKIHSHCPILRARWLKLWWFQLVYEKRSVGTRYRGFPQYLQAYDWALGSKSFQLIFGFYPVVGPDVHSLTLYKIYPINRPGKAVRAPEGGVRMISR
jgi:hypothetical protein